MHCVVEVPLTKTWQDSIAFIAEHIVQGNGASGWGGGGEEVLAGNSLDKLIKRAIYW